MKTIGIIGGLSWFSTEIYYRTINQMVAQRLGQPNSAQIILYSFNFNEFKSMQEANRWDLIEAKLTQVALNLQTAGADCIVIASNTPHLVADRVSSSINIPLIHIMDATAADIHARSISKVGLLGTRFVMESSLYPDRLKQLGITCTIPGKPDRDYIHETIFSELTKGIVSSETQKEFIRIINSLKDAGAQGVILGCTEITLLVKSTDTDIHLFDTTTIHCRAATDFILRD